MDFNKAPELYKNFRRIKKKTRIIHLRSRKASRNIILRWHEIKL